MDKRYLTKFVARTLIEATASKIVIDILRKTPFDNKILVAVLAAVAGYSAGSMAQPRLDAYIDKKFDEHEAKQTD